MAELEKTIEGMKELSAYLFREYSKVRSEEANIYYDRFCAASDALELLKEYQEAKPLIDAISDSVHETAKMFRQNNSLKHYDDGSSEP